MCRFKNTLVRTKFGVEIMFETKNWINTKEQDEIPLWVRKETETS